MNYDISGPDVGSFYSGRSSLLKVAVRLTRAESRAMREIIICLSACSGSNADTVTIDSAMERLNYKQQQQQQQQDKRKSRFGPGFNSRPRAELELF